MKALIIKLRDNTKIKAILYWGMVSFLFLYVFSIPAFSGRPVWYLASYGCMAGLAGFTLIYTFLYTKFSFNKWIIIPASFVIFSFFGTAFYSHSFIGKPGSIGWTSLILMLITLLVFYYAFVGINNKKLVVYVLIAAFLIFAFYFAIHYRSRIIHLKLTSERIDSYFDNQNTIGFYFAIAFTLSLYSSVFIKKKLELLLLIPTLIFFALGFFTGSRAFFVSVIAGSVIVMFSKLKNHKIIFFIALALLVGLFFALINIPQLAFLKDQFDRTIYTIFGIGNSKVDTSTVQRAVWPGYAFYLAGRNLLFGYGVNGFSIYSGVGTYAHNNFAEVMCNFGVAGFLLFNACYIIPVILSIKKKDEYVYLVPILFAIYFFRSFFGVTYYAKEAYLVIALLIYLTKDYKLPNFAIRTSRISSDKYCEVRI